MLGIALGKYLSFAWILSDVAQEQTGGLVEISVFSRDTLFFDELGIVFDWIDLSGRPCGVHAWKTLAPVSPEPEPRRRSPSRVDASTAG